MLAFNSRPSAERIACQAGGYAASATSQSLQLPWIHTCRSPILEGDPLGLSMTAIHVNGYSNWGGVGIGVTAPCLINPLSKPST